MEISRFLTGLDQNQTKILWKQYCEFNPQSPAVQRLKGEGRWNARIFPNVSTSRTESLLSTAQISDENKQNKNSGHSLSDSTVFVNHTNIGCL